jgi:hypothetical protein
MKTKSKIIIINLVLFLIVFSSCKRDKITEESETPSTEESIISTAFDDAFTQANYAHATKVSATKSTEAIIQFESDTAIITVITPDTTKVFPKIITIDFGTGTTDRNGNVRKGKIIAEVSGLYRTIGATNTITFENYFINDIQLTGTKTVTNMGLNGSNQTYFSIKVRNAKATTADGKIITWEADRVRTWIQGESTKGFLGIFDDEYDIDGTSSGTCSNGSSFNSTITTPLRVKNNCRYITKGIIEIIVDGNPAVILDYGNDVCDDIATITYRNKEKEIKLRR